MLSCKICKQNFSFQDFNRHPWRSHNITLKEYFEKYSPQKDLHTNEIIPFNKNIEKYLKSNFINKKNMISWLKNQPLESKKEYYKNLLLNRKNEKNLIFAPSNFELRSLMIPNIIWCEKTMQNMYSNICKEIELKERFNYNQILEIDSAIQIILEVDTRDQHVLKFPNMEIKKLNFGDYHSNSGYNQDVYMERKSLIDIIGSMSNGFERFVRELERVVINNNYLVVLIEEKYSHLSSFNYLPHTKFSKASPDFILNRIREICLRFPLRCQFVCVDGRDEAIRVINNVYRLKNDIKTMDLDYFYSLGQI